MAAGHSTSSLAGVQSLSADAEVLDTCLQHTDSDPVWQVASGEAAAAHVGSLQTAQEVLAALSKAHAATARIQSGAGLASHRVLPLPGLRTQRLKRCVHDCTRL